MAYEVGFREQMTERFSWDLATFYNAYHDLLSFDFPSPGLMQTGNGAAATTYGAELAATYAVSER